MSARTKARVRALGMLFQAEVNRGDITAVVEAEAERAQHEPERLASWVYAREIVDGVTEHQEELDELISTCSLGWSLERMPNVDRVVLRIATWEMLYADDVPFAVAVDEAVDIVKEYSTDDSGKFVNGVLAGIAGMKGIQ